MNEQHNRMNRQEAAEYLGVTSQTLRNWEVDGRGPRFYRLAGKRILYLQRDLDAFIAQSAIDPAATDDNH